MGDLQHKGTNHKVGSQWSLKKNKKGRDLSLCLIRNDPWSTPNYRKREDLSTETLGVKALRLAPMRGSHTDERSCGKWTS